MKNFIFALVVCVALAISTQTFGQDCSNGRCRPVATPVKNVFKKINDRQVIEFEIKIKNSSKWNALRPKNWMKRFKSWRCCK